MVGLATIYHATDGDGPGPCSRCSSGVSLVPLSYRLASADETRLPRPADTRATRLVRTILVAMLLAILFCLGSFVSAVLETGNTAYVGTPPPSVTAASGRRRP